MLKKINTILLIISLLSIKLIYADESLIDKSMSNVSGTSGALAAYIKEVAGNLNDFVYVGFLIALFGAAVSIVFTQENVLKALGKVSFGLFVLKMCVAAMSKIVK